VAPAPALRLDHTTSLVCSTSKLVSLQASLERNIEHRHRQPMAGRIRSTSVVPEPKRKSPAALTICRRKIAVFHCYSASLPIVVSRRRPTPESSRAAMWRRCAEAFTVEPGWIETADPFFPGSQHVTRIFYPALASLCLFRRLNPVYPVYPGNGCRGIPYRLGLRGSGKRCFEVWRQLRFRLLRHGSNLQRNRISYLYARSFTQRFADL